MNTKGKLLQPLVSAKLSASISAYTSVTSPARMDIYEFTMDHLDSHQLSFIPTPYCEWIIGYNETPDESVFCCVGPVSKLKTIELPHFNHYMGIRFDDHVCYINKNASRKASSAGMRDQFFLYNPSKDSYEYKFIQNICSSKNISDHVAELGKFLSESKRLCYISENVSELFTKLKMSNGSLSISELSSESGYSERHISRIITNQFGFGPKDYCKYIRFQKALAEILSDSNRENSEFIKNIGYSDQAHFQREFKLFLGITPKQYIHLL